eukprot:1196399-Prorocentrum_minimum.AAC.4
MSSTDHFTAGEESRKGDSLRRRKAPHVPVKLAPVESLDYEVYENEVYLAEQVSKRKMWSIVQVKGNSSIVNNWLRVYPHRPLPLPPELWSANSPAVLENSPPTHKSNPLQARRTTLHTLWYMSMKWILCLLTGTLVSVSVFFVNYAVENIAAVKFSYTFALMRTSYLASFLVYAFFNCGLVLLAALLVVCHPIPSNPPSTHLVLPRAAGSTGDGGVC